MKKLTLIYKVKNNEFKKYHSTNLQSTNNFVIRKFGGYFFVNVYDSKTKVKIKTLKQGENTI